MDTGFEQDLAGMTRYFRVLPDCHAIANMPVDSGVLVRQLSTDEVTLLGEQLRRHNVFARHPGGGYYTSILGEMANRTIVEMWVPGEPKDVAPDASFRASVVEDLVLIAASLRLGRSVVAKRVQPRDPEARQVELAIGPRFYHLRARSPRIRGIARVVLDASFGSRFAKHGFGNLYQLSVSHTDMGERVRHAVRWLGDAVREGDLPSAVIYLAIALETMLVFSESESLARSLGERAAFLLADSESMRSSIDATIKRFYDVRSGVAHGSRRRLRNLSVPLVDGATRLILVHSHDPGVFRCAAPFHRINRGC